MRIMLMGALAALLVTFCATASMPDYFGEKPPGSEPQLFQYQKHIPGDFIVVNLLFSPDGNEFYFVDERTRNTYLMRKTENGWSKPEIASFANEGHNYEPFLTADNKQMYFVSTRPPGSGRFNGRLWRAERNNDGTWASPELLFDRPTEDGFWFPNTFDGKTIYFGATLEDSLGEGDFYTASHDGKEWIVSHLEPPFNTADYEWDPIVSPDGSYLLMISRRDQGYGATDIYVSFKKGDEFGEPINLGSKINTAEYETAATLSPDGNYMFYVLAPDGRAPEIYWVSTEVITGLRTKN